MDFKTLATLAQLSDVAYQADPTGSVPGWQVLSAVDLGLSFPTGFLTSTGPFAESADHVFAFVAYDAAEHELGLIFRGTDPSDPANLELDILGIPTGLLINELGQFAPLISAAETFAASHGAQLLTAGHSLGGALAELLYETDASVAAGAGFGNPTQPLPGAQRTEFVSVARDQDIIPFSSPVGAHVGPVLHIDNDDKPGDPQLAPDPLPEHSFALYASELARIAAVEPGASPSGRIVFTGVDGFESRVTNFAATTYVGGDFGNAITSSPTSGNDTIIGGNVSDFLSGGQGSDALFGLGGADTVAGGGGSDFLSGGAGGDRYEVSADGSQETISDNGGDGTDVVALHHSLVALNPSWFRVDGNDLLINDGGNNIDVRIVGMGTTAGQIERLDFYGSGGSQLTSSLDLGALWTSLKGTTLFSDNFNRANGPVGNDWSPMSGLTDSLVIQGGRLAASTAIVGDGGVYRHVDLTGGVEISATLTNGNGFAGLDNRFVTQFLVGSDGVADHGLAVVFYRGDINYANSAVLFLKDGVQIGQVDSTFQFDHQIHVDFTVRPDGAVSGVVDGSGQEFAFDFSGATYDSTHQNIGLDEGYGGAIASTIDDLIISKPGTAVLNQTAGGGGADLIGTFGKDVLQGGSGADTLDGGLGPDRLTGGAGGDAFVFRAGALGASMGTADTNITDFERGATQDQISLRGFGDGSTVVFAGVASTGIGLHAVTTPWVQFYHVIDPTNAAASGYFEVTMADHSAAHLTAADFSFFHPPVPI